MNLTDERRRRKNPKLKEEEKKKKIFKEDFQVLPYLKKQRFLCKFDDEDEAIKDLFTHKC